ncbi:RNA recognition motif (RRM)-containing protein [Tasmannia lanceolata]|uniref:RNA recognition motif (RRM)-containing protein n=1 Tax=Tasmannia lanceolata TaxID=3420 RepID=UPI0040630337
MNFSGERDRFRREYSPRYEEKGRFGRNSLPPSRHLWVGNLSHHITESSLSEQFLRFGEIESIAFLPGRSYAFVNFKKDEDASIAMRALQGFVVAGFPLKIEFTKGEKPLTSSHGEVLQNRDEGRPEHVEHISQRDSRMHRGSPERYYDKYKGDMNAEPSEVLWIGFPSFLNIDEMILRRTFSPYGEIEKITAFPGRSYAFVQFRSVGAACRAKEALHGKLFNNPRVHICFARSEGHVRNSMNAPFPSHSALGGQANEIFQQRKHLRSPSGEFRKASPHFISNLDKMTRDPGPTGFGINNLIRGLSEDIYEHHSGSPALDRGALRNDFPAERPPRRSKLFEEPWDFPDDSFLFRDAKKLKTSSFPEKELPEYPFSDSEQEKQHIDLPKLFSDLPERETYDKNIESGSFGFKRIPDNPNNLPRPHVERNEPWNIHDSFEAGSVHLPDNPGKWQRFTPESHQSPLNEEWKWEGTIAKGGTPVCRARCFPVGKVLDVMLPDFLNCTARTGLDMLAKHFYQAASFWVVFFVPHSDPDITFYNEFMHFLGEKQRAAVAKLSEKTTLFLVPPSDFSEKVLKVPGKVSISGVILKFQHPNSDFSSLHHPMDSKLPSLVSNLTSGVGFHEDMSYPKPSTPELKSSSRDQSYINPSSEMFPSATSGFTSLRKPGISNLSYMEKVSDSVSDIRFDQLQHQNPALPSNWSPHQMRHSNPSIGNFPSQPSTVSSQPFDDSILQEYLSKPRVLQGSTSSQYTPGISGIPLSGDKFSQHETKSQLSSSMAVPPLQPEQFPSSGIPLSGSKFSQPETKPQLSSSMPVPPLQPEQFALLASLLGQRQQVGTTPVLSMGEDHNQSRLPNHPEQPLKPVMKSTTMQNHGSSDLLASQFSQVHQLQNQTSNVSAVPQTTIMELQTRNSESQGSQQVQNNAGNETEADPQKRLQATLQLAAALLQQIQQQAKAVDQR